MTSKGWNSATVRARLEALGADLSGASRRAEWSTIGADAVLVVTSTADRGDSLGIRLSGVGALLGVNTSDAMEFTFDDDDVDDLITVATAFYRGDLELVISADDRECFGVQVGALRMTASSSLWDRWRSKPRRVRSMR